MKNILDGRKDRVKQHTPSPFWERVNKKEETPYTVPTYSHFLPVWHILFPYILLKKKEDIYLLEENFRLCNDKMIL